MGIPPDLIVPPFAVVASNKFDAVCICVCVCVCVMSPCWRGWI